MTDLPDRVDDPKGGDDLRARARLNEIDRRTSVLKFRVGFLRWLVLPVFFVALVAMVAGLIFGLGTLEEMIGGIVAIGGGAAGFVNWVGRLRDEISELADEKASASGVLPAPSGEDRGRIGRPK